MDQFESSLHENKASAYFPPLTLDDLNTSYKNRPAQQYEDSGSMESDFDMSQSKLKYLGVDLSSLQIIDQQTPQAEMEEMKHRFNEFSRSVQTYARKFDSHDSTGLHSKDQSNISLRMDHFRRKIQELQNDLESQPTKSPTSDPYKISLHSIHPQRQPSKSPRKQSQPERPQQQQQQQFSQSQSQNQSRSQYHNANSSSVSSGGLSFQPPQLYSTSTKKALPFTPGSQLSDLEFHRIRYYDSFLPEGQRMLNCPYKLFKHKMQSRNKQALTRCLEDFNLMDIELTQSLR